MRNLNPSSDSIKPPSADDGVDFFFLSFPQEWWRDNDLGLGDDEGQRKNHGSLRMRPRPRPSSVVCERIVLTDYDDEDYITSRRNRRLLTGSRHFRKCVSLLLVGLVLILSSQTYSHAYYASFAMSFLTFGLTLPSALPSDGPKVSSILKVIAFVKFWVCLLCVYFTIKASFAYSRGTCVAVLGTPEWYCLWDVIFWIFPIFPTVAVAAKFWVARKTMPHAALNLFWLYSGYYNITLGTHNFFDLVAGIVVGIFDQPKHHHALVWRFVITIELWAMGFFSLNKQWKLHTWRFVASLGSCSIRSRKDGPLVTNVVTLTRTSSLDRGISDSSSASSSSQQQQQQQQQRPLRCPCLGDRCLCERRRRSPSPPHHLPTNRLGVTQRTGIGRPTVLGPGPQPLSPENAKSMDP